MYQKTKRILCVIYFVTMTVIISLMLKENHLRKKDRAMLSDLRQEASTLETNSQVLIREAHWEEESWKDQSFREEHGMSQQSEPADDIRQACDEQLYEDTEIMVLERIVEAEAGGEDEDGKLLVANVVLNRVHDDAFPNTISEVVFQRSGGVIQFSPVANGRYEEVTVSDESKAAVERALNGEDISEGALYFAARQYADKKNMRWFDENLTALFQHGGHEFFK